MSKIFHCLWYDNQAEEAVRFYLSIFEDAKMGKIVRYGKEGFEIHGRPEGSVMTVDFELFGQRYQARNGGPFFKFNEAFSIVVQCEDQKEIDYYWEKLTADGGEEGPCGWLKDKFGLSWQIAPRIMEKMMGDPVTEKTERVVKAFMQMKKFDIAQLEAAYRGEK